MPLPFDATWLTLEFGESSVKHVIGFPHRRKRS